MWPGLLHPNSPPTDRSSIGVRTYRCAGDGGEQRRVQQDERGSCDRSKLHNTQWCNPHHPVQTVVESFEVRQRIETCWDTQRIEF
jgi:hypothetical protein